MMRDWLWFQFVIRAKLAGATVERLTPHRVFCEHNHSTLGEWWHTPYYDHTDDFGKEELAHTGDFDDCVTQLMAEPEDSERVRWLVLKAYYLHPIPTAHPKHTPVDPRAPYGIKPPPKPST